MEPLFKIGDKVRVVERIHDIDDYRDFFVDSMAILAGNVYTIESISTSLLESTKVPDDGYSYRLKENSIWSWNSSMLEKVEEINSVKETQPRENNDSVLKIKLKKKNNIKLNFNN